MCSSGPTVQPRDARRERQPQPAVYSIQSYRKLHHLHQGRSRLNVRTACLWFVGNSQIIPVPTQWAAEVDAPAGTVRRKRSPCTSCPPWRHNDGAQTSRKKLQTTSRHSGKGLLRSGTIWKAVSRRNGTVICMISRSSSGFSTPNSCHSQSYGWSHSSDTQRSQFRLLFEEKIESITHKYGLESRWDLAFYLGSWKSFTYRRTLEAILAFRKSNPDTCLRDLLRAAYKIRDDRLRSNGKGAEKSLFSFSPSDVIGRSILPK